MNSRNSSYLQHVIGIHGTCCLHLIHNVDNANRPHWTARVPRLTFLLEFFGFVASSYWIGNFIHYRFLNVYRSGYFYDDMELPRHAKGMMTSEKKKKKKKKMEKTHIAFVYRKSLRWSLSVDRLISWNSDMYLAWGFAVCLPNCSPELRQHSKIAVSQVKYAFLYIFNFASRSILIFFVSQKLKVSKWTFNYANELFADYGHLGNENCLLLNTQTSLGVITRY